MSFKIPSISELLRFSGNRPLGREEKKVLCLRKNIYISKKQAESNELRANCTFEIITFRYFAFFLELTFYFFIIYSFYIFFVRDLFRYARAHRAYR